MATTQHSNLTGAELHEPKGVDSATNKQVYVSDGAGSGSWINWPTGWAYYVDSKTGASVQTITTSASVLECDGAGATTEDSYLPISIRGSGSLWDTTNDLITPIEIGDSYSCRVDITVAAKSGSPHELTFDLDIGGGATPTVVILEKYIGLAKTPPYKLSIGFPIFCLSTFKTNGGQFFLSTDTGAIDINEISILLSRLHCGAGL